MKPFDFQDGEVGPLAVVFRRLRDTLNSIADAVTNAHLVSVTFTAATTDTPVRHGLSMPVRTWEVVDRSANAVVWKSATANDRPRDFIILQASAPVTVLLRVS